MVVAVIGAGSIGKRHAGNLTQLGVANTLIGYRTFLPAMLDDAAMNGVVIATATPIRAEIASLCAARNLPMYIEKPLGWTRAQVAELYDIAAPVADCSMVGYMMRYHPVLAALKAIDLSQAYGFMLEIGHDVRQWRTNWSFADSYAASADGGGVLLDLCHELDIAACLFDGLHVDQVSCLGHRDFAGVDFATRIALSNGMATGTVCMDYLNPVSTRHASLRTLDDKIEIDMLTPAIRSQAGEQAFAFERNDMFLDAMRDFVALCDGTPTSGNPLMPRMATCRASCDLIATAWEARTFTGHVDLQIG